MNRSLRKELWREIRQSRNRFLSIFIMVSLGVLFLVGLRSAAPDMRATADTYFDESRLYDIEIISTLGLTKDDIAAFSNTEGVESAIGAWSLDAMLSFQEKQDPVKLHSVTSSINVSTVVSGRMPEASNECALDEKLISVLNVSLGDKIGLEPGKDASDALRCQEFVVTGFVRSPIYISFDRGNSSLGDGSVSGFVLLPEDSFALDSYSVAYLTAAETRDLDAYGQEYKTRIDALTDTLEEVAETRAERRYESIRSDAETTIHDAQKTLDDGQAEGETAISDSREALQRARETLDAGWATLEENQQAYDLASSYGMATEEMAEALNDARKQLEDGETEYAAGMQQLEEAQEELDRQLSAGQEEIDQAKTKLEELMPADVYVLDRNTNYGFVSYDQNATRMDNLARVFPLIFFVVAALVCLTTMTRMVEEERTQIGTIKALGFGTMSIAAKFLFYGMLAAIGGSVLGCIIGATLIPWVIFTSYGIMYTLPPLEMHVYWGLCIGSGLAGLFCTCLATLWAIWSTARQTPATLMRPKAPKAGKRILLERIPFLWRKMSFSMKVSARNLFRYKKRFWMTVIGVAGCTALLIAGLGLRSSIFNILDIQFGDIYQYDVVISLDEDVPDGESDVSDLLERSGNLLEKAAVNTRAVTFMHDGVSTDGYLTLSDDPDALYTQIKFRDMKTKEHVILPAEGALIDLKLAELLDLKVGDTLEIDAGTRFRVQVAGIVEHYVYHYAYLSSENYEALTGEKRLPNEYLITCADTSDEAISDLSEQLMALDGVQSVSNLVAMARSFRETMEVVDAAVLIIILSAAALALVVLYNLTNINITERIRELATIKVLGFFDEEVAMYIYRENILLTLLGIALGQPLGKLLCTWLVRTIEMDAVMFGRDAMTRDYVISIALSLIFAAVVNVLMYFRMKKIDMVESLKSVE